MTRIQYRQKFVDILSQYRGGHGNTALITRILVNNFGIGYTQTRFRLTFAETRAYTHAAAAAAVARLRINLGRPFLFIRNTHEVSN